jgi:hypothetical protein
VELGQAGNRFVTRDLFGRHILTPEFLIRLIRSTTNLHLSPHLLLAGLWPGVCIYSKPCPAGLRVALQTGLPDEAFSSGGKVSLNRPINPLISRFFNRLKTPYLLDS